MKKLEASQNGLSQHLISSHFGNLWGNKAQIDKLRNFSHNLFKKVHGVLHHAGLAIIGGNFLSDV
jgi:hypothetical protein